MLTKDTKLRFWCQKVLPLVYDDSLSYYELLNKVVLHLNQNTENINQLIDFYNTFAEDVEDIIRQMMEDGDFNEIVADTLGSIIAEEYDPTKSYIIFDYCIFESKLYRANSSTTGVFDPEKWDEKTVGYDLTTIQNYIYSLNADNVAYDNSETYSAGTVGAFIKSISTIINNAIITKRIETIDDLATSENHFVHFSADVVVGGTIFPEFSKGVLVSQGGTDATLYAINLEGKLYTAFRNNGTWVNGKCLNNEISALNGAINSNQLNVATVESGLTASQNYSVGDFVIVNGRLRRVISNISSGQQFQSGTNIATTEIGNEMAMKEYLGTIDPTFEAMGADSFYLRCYAYFHTFAILFLSFYTPAVTPDTFITIGHFPNSCKPAKNGSITWTGQKGGAYLISFSTDGTVSLYCTDATPEAQFVRIYIPLPVII